MNFGSLFGNVDSVNGALAKTGSNYRLPTSAPASAVAPASVAAPAATPAAPLSPPTAAAAPPAATGGGEAPSWLGKTQKIGSLMDNLPAQDLRNSEAVQMVKKAVSAVASFYTGGLSSLATNVGGQVVGKNNPKLGQAVGMFGGGFGGGGG